jgi:hypothetical protein
VHIGTEWSMGPVRMGPAASANQHPLKVRIQARHFQMAMHWKDPHTFSPLTSLALGLRSAAAKPVFVKSVLANL